MVSRFGLGLECLTKSDNAIVVGSLEIGDLNRENSDKECTIPLLLILDKENSFTLSLIATADRGGPQPGHLE